MSIRAGKDQLALALKELRARWEQARGQWRDPRAQEIEDQFMAPLSGIVRSALEATEQLGKVVSKAKRDCE